MRIDQHALETGVPTIGCIEKFTALSGETRYLRMDNAPLQNAEGDIDRLVVISTDISDVVRANDQLREAEERLDMALSASSTGLWDWDVRTGSTYFNHVVFQIIGYQPGELEMSMLAWRDQCHPEDLARVTSALNEHIDGATDTYSCEYRVRRKDNSYIWVRDVGQVVDRDTDGTPKRIVGVYIDIQAIRDALDQAEQSQQRFELAIEGSRDAIFDWNLDTGNVWFSRRWLQLLNVPEGALGSTIPDLLWHVAPEDSTRLNRELSEFVDSDDQRFDSEFQLVDGNDAAVWVMMRAVAFRNDAGRVTRVAGSVADITSLKEAHETMERLIQLDHLTGLASRARLAERLEHAVKRVKRNGNYCGVLFFDFDRFKVVNDSLGHDVGDELLCSIADRLRSNVREVDTPARFGGDEFVILLEDLKDPSDARIVADKLLDICAAPHQIRGHSLVSTASIGLVTSEHADSSASDLLRYADAAMYEAKRNGRACVVEFDKAMFDAQQQSAELEEELQGAIERRELELHYQPVVDLQTGDIVSAEALLRWNHPGKGYVPPGDFISIAEESRQIVAIGQWVIEEACRQLLDWRERGVVSDEFAVSVNASKVQLLTPGFERMLVDEIDSHGLPRNALKIEVTETTIVDNRSDIGDVLRSLRDQSIVIMMDDFGTGHSSLSVLHKLPVDELKIDQSFIRHADKNRELVAITSSIVTLAEHLSLKTIGEGIEGQEHVALLQTLGCTYGQGYFWSRPIPAADIEVLLGAPDKVHATRLA
jgi:diguanylate cyclase (GGDEF)-like protein/PAS domain S-box-containing protein